MSKIVAEANYHLLTPENFSVQFTDGLSRNIQIILQARLLLKGNCSSYNSLGR